MDLLIEMMSLLLTSKGRLHCSTKAFSHSSNYIRHFLNYPIVQKQDSFQPLALTSKQEL